MVKVTYWVLFLTFHMYNDYTDETMIWKHRFDVYSTEKQCKAQLKLPAEAFHDRLTPLAYETIDNQIVTKTIPSCEKRTENEGH